MPKNPGTGTPAQALRELGLWAADCAELALPVFEDKAPADSRPRAAIAGIRAFAHGGPRTNELRALAWAAMSAGRDARDAAANSAARAASLAAAAAFTHLDVISAHQLRHALGPAVYAAQALELAAAGDPGVGDQAIRRAIARSTPVVRELVQRWPSPAASRTRLGQLYHLLDSGVRN